ncbi:hypothetical protein LB505_008169 [Fusarium chuoi]|nr:hypothetical protein LB505_008169 [Fusarium chuoi]
MLQSWKSSLRLPRSRFPASKIGTWGANIADLAVLDRPLSSNQIISSNVPTIYTHGKHRIDPRRSNLPSMMVPHTPMASFMSAMP